MKRMLMVLLPLLALTGGAGAGLYLKPHDQPGQANGAADATGHDAQSAEADAHGEVQETSGLPDYVKLSNQFVIPILRGSAVTSLVVLSLSLEVVPGHSEEVYAREPKLRDAFLQVMFDHANAGGFSGEFTENAALGPLRQALREAATAILGTLVTDVLISDIVRQDA